MRALIVGDVHGCYDKLINLLVMFDDYDELIFVGDLIDRGPDVKKTVDYVLDLKDKMGDRLHYLWGNHEFEWVHWYDQYYNGEIDESYKEKFKAVCEPFYKSEKFNVVHGGCAFEEDFDTWNIRDLIWDRDAIRYKGYSGKFMIVGHTPLELNCPLYINGESVIKMDEEEYAIPERGVMDIDTSAVFGGVLTGVLIDTEADKMWIRSVK